MSVQLKFIYPLFIDKIKFEFIKLEFEEVNAFKIPSLIGLKLKSSNSNLYDHDDVILLTEFNTDLNINKLQYLKQLTINLDLMITAVYKNGDIISNWKDYFVKTAQQKYNFVETKTNECEYVWKICQSELQQMKAIKNVFGYFSPIFEAHSLKWFINFFPNGKNIQNNGSIDLCLNFASCLEKQLHKLQQRYPTYLRVIAKCTIRIEEINYEYQSLKYFKSVNDQVQIPSHTHNIQMLDSDALTIKINIELIDVYKTCTVSINRELITYNFTMRAGWFDLPITKRKLVWKIRRASLTNLVEGYSILSRKYNAFSLNWNIVLFPNISGLSKVFIELCDGCPAEIIFYARCAVTIVEADIRYTVSTRFIPRSYSEQYIKDPINYLKRSDLCGFNDAILTTKTFAQLNSCTIIVEIELVDVFQNGCDVIDKFIGYM